jgi:preprotein translocase subunit SecA
MNCAAKIEDTAYGGSQDLFNQIDKLEKDVLERYEGIALNEVMPIAFNIEKIPPAALHKREETVVTANDFDRELAATHDFVRIEGDKAIYRQPLDCRR